MNRWLRNFLWAALLWTALAVVFATQLYFAGLPWSQALAWSIPRWYSWGIVTPAVFWLDKRLGRGRPCPSALPSMCRWVSSGRRCRLCYGS